MWGDRLRRSGSSRIRDAVIGRGSVDDKLQEGDRKTPEGIFHIRDRYPHPDWSKFIGLDYPRPQSWRNHLRAKLSRKLNLLFPMVAQLEFIVFRRGRTAEFANGRIGRRNAFR